MDHVMYSILKKQINAVVIDDKINSAVNNYLEKNPPETGATAEQVEQIHKNSDTIDDLKTDVISNSNKIGELKEDLDNIKIGKKVVDLLDRNWNDKTTLNNWCEYISTTNLRYFGDGDIDVSDYVGETIHFVIDNTDTSSCIYAFINNDGSYKKTTINESTDVVIGSNAKILRLCVLALDSNSVESSKESIKVYIETVGVGYDESQKLISKIPKIEYVLNPNYSYALNKILCIGDSLTSGAYYGSTDIWSERGTSIKQNYPSVLGRMLCCETINGGVSGIDSINWYKQKYETIIDDTEQEDSKWFDSVIIWLGTNGGYTDTFADDVEQYGTNYNQYADTAVGNLCKIVQRIKTYHPNRFMAICTLFTEPNTSKASNKVIKEVADYYELLTIDMSDLTYDNFPNLHYGMKFIESDGIMHSNPHFNKAGNIFIADRIARKINEYLSANLLSCDFGMQVRDDEYYGN